MISLLIPPADATRARESFRALRDLARRWKQLDDEVKVLNKQIEALVRSAAPELLELHGVGVEIAGQFLVTAGDNADRIRSVSVPFAHMVSRWCANVRATLVQS